MAAGWQKRRECVITHVSYSDDALASICIEGQGELLGVAYKSPVSRVQRGGGQRGVVTSFSRASRRRLLKTIARLDMQSAVFITLTYPSQYPTAKEAKQHLRALLERFRRRFPRMSAIWRMEYQQRGAPHFHLICFNMPYLPFADLRRMWGQITIRFADGPQLPFVRIEMVRSKRGVMHYASKYLAKTEQAVPGGGVSLTPAHICTPDCGCTHEQGVQAEKAFDEAHSGRFWGVHNAAALPYAERVLVEIWTRHGNRALPEVKAYFRRAWAGVNKSRYRGAVIFASGAKRKAEAAIRMVMEYAQGAKAHDI
jgi:hypothetical protein